MSELEYSEQVDILIGQMRARIEQLDLILGELARLKRKEDEKQAQVEPWHSFWRDRWLKDK